MAPANDRCKISSRCARASPRRRQDIMSGRKGCQGKRLRHTVRSARVCKLEKPFISMRSTAKVRRALFVMAALVARKSDVSDWRSWFVERKSGTPTSVPSTSSAHRHSNKTVSAMSPNRCRPSLGLRAEHRRVGALDETKTRMAATSAAMTWRERRIAACPVSRAYSAAICAGTGGRSNAASSSSSSSLAGTLVLAGSSFFTRNHRA
jgi:hypothetical protein